MNKHTVDRWIPLAYQVLETEYPDGVVKKTVQGYFSTFGAAITTGSLLATVCFFKQAGGSEQDKAVVYRGIEAVLLKAGVLSQKTTLQTYVMDETQRDGGYAAKENCINAALALKLALNLFSLSEEGEEEKK